MLTGARFYETDCISAIPLLGRKAEKVRFRFFFIETLKTLSKNRFYQNNVPAGPSLAVLYLRECRDTMCVSRRVWITADFYGTKLRQTQCVCMTYYRLVWWNTENRCDVLHYFEIPSNTFDLLNYFELQNVSH